LGAEPTANIKTADLVSIMRLPPAQRVVADQAADAYCISSRTGDFYRQMADIWMLSYAISEASARYLDELAKNSNSLELSGVASYSLFIRRIAGNSKSEKFGLLSYELAKATNPLERMFLANRLATDFKDQGALWVILANTLADPPVTHDSMTLYYNGVCKSDMLYYLAHSGNVDIDRAIVDLKINYELREGSLDHQMAYLMSAITPGRPSDEMLTYWLLLQKVVKDDLARHEADDRLKR
jgi:hypothetical protein